MKISLDGFKDRDPNIGGLSDEDKKILNGSNIKYSNKDISELLGSMRRKYSSDTLARQQIDTYDTGSSYSKVIAEYREARATNDAERIALLEKWLKIWYPDIHSD